MNQKCSQEGFEEVNAFQTPPENTFDSPMLLRLLDLLTVVELSSILWAQAKFVWATITERPVYFYLSLGIRPGKGVRMLQSEEKSAPMSTAEAGRKGGRRVRDKYGEDYYRRIGKKGGTALKEKRGSDYYRDIARKGGQANVSKYGSDHFSEMGKKGGNTTKERQDPDFYSRIGKLGGAAKRLKNGS